VLQDSPEAAELARSAAGLVERERGVDGDSGFNAHLWLGLAELGVLGLATEEGGGGPVEVVAVMEALGGVRCSGPLAPTFLATQLLPRDERRPIVTGTGVVGVAEGDLVSWGPVATVVLAVAADGSEAWLLRATDGLVPVEVLGGEIWGQGAVERVRRLRAGPRLGGALALNDLAVGAWCAGAARALLAGAVDHARNRHQFGRAIGDFQAVAHLLATCEAELGAAQSLLRLTAARATATLTESRALAAAARLATTRASLQTAYAAHQVYGALGFSAESGIGAMSAAIRRCASAPPGPAPAEAALYGSRALTVIAGPPPNRPMQSQSTSEQED
jgi:alkylation response protein AidB-like acyl-CoA dehydrogenase